MVYFECTSDITTAITREKQIKGWTRQKKNELIQSVNPKWRIIYGVLEIRFFATLRMTWPKVCAQNDMSEASVFQKWPVLMWLEWQNPRHVLRMIRKSTFVILEHKEKCPFFCHPEQSTCHPEQRKGLVSYYLCILRI